MSAIKKYLYGCENKKDFTPVKQILIFAISKSNAEKYFRSSSLKTEKHKFIGEVDYLESFNGVCITTEEACRIIREQNLLFLNGK